MENEERQEPVDEAAEQPADEAGEQPEPEAAQQPADEQQQAEAAEEPEKPKRTVRTRTRAAKPAAAAPNEKPKPRGRAASRAGRAKAAERKPITRTPKPVRERSKPKERRGVVVSDAMDKTIVVRIETPRPHPIYKKVLRRSKKIHADDPENRAKVGDIVRVVATRPLSKTKTWRLAEIVEAAK